MIIEDGKGTGYKAQVDTHNRLIGAVISEEQKDYAANQSVKFNINTGDITLTDATATSVLYVKNNEDYDLVISSIIYNMGNSTGGSGDAVWNIYRNPTAGTIITDAVTTGVIGAGVSANQNFGSSRTLSATIYKGDTADNDFTSGDITIRTRLSSATGRTVISLGSLNIPKGSAIGVSYTPPAGNTSQIIQCAIACYVAVPAVTEH